MTKNLQKGFIVTPTMFTILTMLSIILSLNSFTEEQKNDFKKQSIFLIEREIASQMIFVEQEPPSAPTVEVKKMSADDSTAKDYYKEVSFSQHGKGIKTLPNKINYEVTNDGYFGKYAGALEITIEKKYRFPVNWLIEKNYIPESIEDLPRMQKVFLCEYRIYLAEINLHDWKEGEKNACEYFINLTPEEQYQYNLDYRDETGQRYF